MLPLEGITVIAVEQAVAAPFATRQLADLGARVIKVERPRAGDCARAYDGTVNGMASHFVWLNRSKQSLTLDLKQAEAIDVLRRSEEHTSELQSRGLISYAAFCLKKPTTSPDSPFASERSRRSTPGAAFAAGRGARFGGARAVLEARRACARAVPWFFFFGAGPKGKSTSFPPHSPAK